MQYDVVQKTKCLCRIIDVKLITARRCNFKFVVVKLGKYDTGELLRSLILYEHVYKYMISEMQSRKCHTIDRIAITPHNSVYHILTWDDVDKGICVREHVDEVQKDKDGNPIKYNKIVVYANLDNQNRFTIDEVLDKEYIEVNSSIVQNYLNFNNQQHYLMQQEKKRRKEQEDYEQVMDDLHEAYKERKYSDMDMSEEERVLSALEGGNGELFGY